VRDFDDDATVRDDIASVWVFYLITKECCVWSTSRDVEGWWTDGRERAASPDGRI